MSDEIIIVPAGEEAPQEPSTNENDVAIAEAQAEAATTTAAIMAEAQIKQAEIAADTSKQAEYVERSHFDATINELKEMFSSWQSQQQQQPNEITMISAETSPLSEPETTSEKKTEEASKEPVKEPPSQKPRASAGLRRPFAPGARKKS